MVSFTERDTSGIRLAIRMTSDRVDSGDIIAIKCGIVRHTLVRVRDRRFGWLRRCQYSSRFSETTAEEFEESIFLIDLVQRTESGSAPSLADARSLFVSRGLGTRLIGTSQ